jgi:thymidylate synthase
MRVASGIVVADNLSDAWLQTLRTVADSDERKLFHTVTRVLDPSVERRAVRVAADEMLAARDDQSIETVANTLFPQALADSSPDAAALVRRYRAMYSTIRRLHKSNGRGTYFGRVVAYPSPSGPLDQLSNVIRKLRQELAVSAPKSVRYEVPIDDGQSDPVDAEAPESGREGADREGAPGAADGGVDGGVDGEVDGEVDVERDATATAVPVHAPDRDTSPMDFPCLSMCSFQLDRDTLHLSAHYRSQYLVKRGYGNYLGLARLQRYVADAAGVAVGQLLVVAGLAHVDAPKYRIAALERRVAEAG